MLIPKTKIIEVPPVDISNQTKYINSWINDMVRNGIIIISVNLHPRLNNHYIIEYKDEDLSVEENLYPEEEVLLDDPQ